MAPRKRADGKGEQPTESLTVTANPSMRLTRAAARLASQNSGGDSEAAPPAAAVPSKKKSSKTERDTVSKKKEDEKATESVESKLAVVDEKRKEAAEAEDEAEVAAEPPKKKGKKVKSPAVSKKGETTSESGESKRSVEEEKGKAVVVGEWEIDDGERDSGVRAPSKTIIIEHCKQCNSFKTRAFQVKEGLEKGVSGITVQVNPAKPRRGCFEIREEGGDKFISLLDMKRPFKPMKDLDMQQVIADIVDRIQT
ncbi:hypothetical protein Dimus_020270 [Dionaea muscipula]